MSVTAGLNQLTAAPALPDGWRARRGDPDMM